MQLFKSLGKPIVLIVALSALTISVFKSEYSHETDVIGADTGFDKPVVDQKALKLYKEQQQELQEALKAYFEKAIAKGDLVGVGVSIVRGDSIVISDGFGKRSAKGKENVDGGTVFRLGSLSKGFAGVLAARLKTEGKINWNDKVSDFVPGFQMGDCNNSDQITLATILSHTSGAPYHSYTDLVEAGLPLTDIATRFKTVKPINKPGSTYSYQNAMFALCGEMMHKATDQDITTLLNTEFFEPLHMDHISMDHATLSKEDNVAIPHSKRRYGWQTLKLRNNYYNAVAAGGINANSDDMAKWMQLLLGHHPEIMDKSALQEAFNPVIEIKGRSKYYQRWPGHVSSYYGYGWRIHNFMENDKEKTIIHHGGSVNNFRNEIALYPDSDLGICVLMNSSSKLVNTVIPDLYKIVNEVFNEKNSKNIIEQTAGVTPTF